MRRTISLIAILASVLAGCGSDGSTTPNATAFAAPAAGAIAPVTAAAASVDTVAPAATTAAATTAAATTAAATTTTAAPIELNEVSFDMADFSFTFPDSLPSGPTHFVGHNVGKEVHHATLVRIADGKTIADALGAFAADPKSAYPLVKFFGGPQSVAPGATQSNVVTLDPGNYAVLCVIPGADGIPHAAKGMLKPFTVTDSGKTDPPVPAGDTIVLRNYAFDIPNPLPAHGRIRVNNDADQPHEVAVYRVNDDSSAGDAIAYLSAPTPPPGPSPVTDSGGITAMQSGQVAGIDLDLVPGTYVFICFLPDAKDGMPHFAHGMVKTVEVMN